MTTRLAINGFGRIGRLVLRAFHELKAWNKVEIVAINDTGPLEKMKHLLRWDSVHGPFSPTALEGVAATFERDLARLDWGKQGVDVVLECTGKFTGAGQAGAHLERGAKRVLVAAPAQGADITVVYGVNHDALTPAHKVVSNASCTTNCLAPMIKVLQEAFVLESGYMTTVHAMTGDQNIIDRTHKDPRRARCAPLSMIPTSTGATRAIELIFPTLAGKLSGASVRVPTSNVSLVDFIFTTRETLTKQALNDLFIQASQKSLQGILAVSDEPLVSVDFNHTRPSSIVDLLETDVVNGHMGRLLAWYDNEWAFANRMLDVATLMGAQL